MDKKIRLTIFASGEGTNAENCILYFKAHPVIEVNLIVSNKSNAGVIEKAERNEIPVWIPDATDWSEPQRLLLKLNEYKTDVILLAGFLALVPATFIHSFRGRIVNIHPALLPKYGGRGMYGNKVHEAVLKNGDKETGITIHEVNEEYDKGSILFQTTLKVEANDTIDTIKRKVQSLEHYYLPRVIEWLITGKDFE